MARLPVALFVVAALTGCGASGGEQLESGDSTALRRELSRVRTAATAGDRDAAAGALRSFRIRVAKLRRAERLDRALADQLRAGARQAETRVALEVAAAPGLAEPPPAPTPEPAAEQPPRTDKPAPGKGNGKGRARRDDDDD